MKQNEIIITFLFFFILNYCNGQSVTDSTYKKFIGFRFTFNYNYKVNHYSPVLCFHLKRHNLYAGLDYTYFMTNPPYGDPIDKFKNKIWGINFGYRYYLDTIMNNFCWFFQYNLSFCKTIIKSYQLGPPYSTETKSGIFENIGSVGISYNPTRKLVIFSGIGIGSFGLFFFMIDRELSFPSSYLGLEYKF